MSNRVITNGSINPNATIAPGVVVIEQLTPGSVSGIPSNIGGLIGTANWGPIDSPVSVSSITDYQNNFGDILNETYNMGTALDAATLQGNNGTYVCIRVTDGTETSALTDLLDTQSVPSTGALLTAKYSGDVGNDLQATVAAGSAASSYNVSIGRPNYVAENFINIPSSGAGFWPNLISAINNGQSGIRGPSQLVVASTGDSVAGITVTTPGSYTTQPTISFTGGGGGTGAAATAIMQAISNVVAVGQSGAGSYAPADTITLNAGTGTAPILTVTNTQVISATVASAGTGGTPGTQTVTGTTGTGTKFQASVTVSGGGAITAVLSITVAGDYTVNPTVLTAEPVTGASLTGAELNIKMGVLTATVTTPGILSTLNANPIGQSSTSGTGTGATFTVTYSVASVTVTNRGNLYTSAPTVVFSSGAAAATASLITTSPPAINTYSFTGGTNGNSGVSSTTELGTDGAIPTGMYALTNTGVSLFALVDATNAATFNDQDAFAQITGSQAVLVNAAGQSVSDGISVKNGASLVSNSSVFLLGDWCYWLDTFNAGTTRLISPQGFYLGLMVNISPENSPLNSPINGILATTKSFMNQIYSDQDVVNMMLNGIDVISKPQPGGEYFSSTTGKSCGLDLTTNNVNVQRMANFIGQSIGKSGVIGAYIGQLQTPTVRRRAKGAITAFLRNLQTRSQIEDFQVILNDTNNPNSRVVLGFMEAQVTVQLFSVIIVFLINLTVGTVTIQA